MRLPTDKKLRIGNQVRMYIGTRYVSDVTATTYARTIDLYLQNIRFFNLNDEQRSYPLFNLNLLEINFNSDNIKRVII